MAKKLTAKKAKEIIKHGEVYGKPLTPKQKRYMGFVDGGGKAQTGGWLEKYQDGGDVKGGELSEITVYGKKQYKDALKKQMDKYLADMAKYKQDSTQWAKANQAYQDSLRLYEKDNEVYKLFNEDKLITNKHTLIEKERHDSARKLEKMLKDNDFFNWYHDNLRYGEYREIENILLEDDKVYDASNYPSNTFGAESIGPQHLWRKPIKPVYVKPPLKPKTFSYINYDPTYEDIRMKSLWANIAKQDTTQNIGTLQHFDPLYRQGFTIGEAIRTFPQQIKDQYNIDYIGEQVGIKKHKNGGKIKKLQTRGWLSKYEGGRNLQKQKQLTNFTDYNWLNKYS